MQRELDLQKFIHRQRVSITALLGLLKPRQNHFVDKFSQLIVKEDSADVATSSGNELSDWAKEKMIYAGKMLTSFDSVDRRLINILNLRRERYASNCKVGDFNIKGKGN